MKASAAVRIERIGALCLLLCSGGGLWWLQTGIGRVDAGASARQEQLEYLRVLADSGQQDGVRDPRSLAAVSGILDGRSFAWRERRGICYLVPVRQGSE